jgi:hypothetical protein
MYAFFVAQIAAIERQRDRPYVCALNPEMPF